MEKLDGLILIVNEGWAGGGTVPDPPPPQPVSNRIPVKIGMLARDGGVRILLPQTVPIMGKYNKPEDSIVKRPSFKRYSPARKLFTWTCYGLTTEVREASLTIRRLRWSSAARMAW